MWFVDPGFFMWSLEIAKVRVPKYDFTAYDVRVHSLCMFGKRVLAAVPTQWFKASPGSQNRLPKHMIDHPGTMRGWNLSAAPKIPVSIPEPFSNQVQN